MNFKYTILMPTLLLCSALQQVFADGCTPLTGTGQHITMNTVKQEIKLSGHIEKYQEIGRFTFQQDGGSHVATCEPGATAYAYASKGTPPSKGIDPADTYIDGMPAFNAQGSYNSGVYEYLYVLIDNATGKPYGVESNPSELVVGDSQLKPRPATVILYAGVDNPTKEVSLNSGVGSLLSGRVGTSTSSGISYYFKQAKITPGGTSCSLENAHNMSIRLPRSPISALPEVGSTHAKEKDELRIKCTGDMRASISLNLDNDQVLTDESGNDSVIRNKRERDQEGAKGIGFVVSTDDGIRLENRNSVFLKDLSDGMSYIPIYAEYYRYGKEVSAGKVEAIANFTIEFK